VAHSCLSLIPHDQERYLDTARPYAEGVHVYVDDGISGAEFERRPAFLRMMNALKPRPVFDVIVMSEESRLGREAIETVYALKQIISAACVCFSTWRIASAPLRPRPTNS